jgi:isoleucyl-tRNA synthetase
VKYIGVIPWDAVSEAEGTGIVHIAPGCGKEDFALGKEEGLVPIAPLNEAGIFLHGFGALEGQSALNPVTIDWIVANLQQKGVLVAVEPYPHNYPHCWRCKTELLFRLVDEWFIDMRWRDAIMKICHDARWVPDFGLQRELDWLKNMGDWMISKSAIGDSLCPSGYVRPAVLSTSLAVVRSSRIAPSVDGSNLMVTLRTGRG